MNETKREPETQRCVHTEHCCIMHGCKYGDGEFCPVKDGTKRQSYLCESCNPYWELTDAQETAMWKKIHRTFEGKPLLDEYEARAIAILHSWKDLDRSNEDGVETFLACLADEDLAVIEAILEVASESLGK